MNDPFSTCSKTSSLDNMDPQRGASEHLPDENYIERLFPKCPPKQSLYSTGDQNKPKRLQGVRGSRDTQAKTRSKVHQHSRRELEARRNKIKTTNYSENKANASDSSDTEGNGLNKKDNSSRQPTNDALQRSMLSSDATPSSIPSTSRRVGKYAASQSLRLQLQRSQSSYANGNIASNHQSGSNKNSTEPKITATGQDKVVCRTTGIVKSSSSFAFVNEPKPLSPNTYSQQQQQQQQQHAYNHSTINQGQEVNQYLQTDDKMDNNIEIDDREKDPTIGSEFNYNNNYNNVNRSSILKGNWSRRETTDREALQSWNDNEVGYNNTTALENNQLNNNDKSLDTLNNSEVNIVVRKDNHARASETRFDSSTPALNSTQSAANASFDRTADFCSRDKIDISNKSESQSNSVLIDPTAQLTNQTNLQTSLNKSDKTILIKANSVDKIQDSSNQESIEQKDDDKYINLFVYDSPAQTNQKNQIASADKQQRSSRNPSKKSRYRKRLERLSSHKKNLTSRTSEEVFDTSNIEITGIIDEEQSNVLVSTSTSPHIEPSASLSQAQLKQVDIEQPLKHYRQENDSSPNIVAIHHQVSQQLLTTSDSNNQEDNIIRNDASTEELCCNSDDLVDELRKSSVEIEHNIDKRISHPSLGKLSSCLKASSIITTLQTVDENAEINIQEQSTIEDDESVKTDLDGRTSTDTMPFDHLINQTTKKGFVPPGYPQLVRPPKTTVLEHREDSLTLAEAIKDIKPNKIVDDRLDKSDNTSEIESTQDSSLRSARADNLRVKFDEENLVRVRDQLTIDQSNTDYSSAIPISGATGDKLYGTSARRSEHHPQMPSISEGRFELDIESVKDEDPAHQSCTPIERDLSAGLKNVLLSDFPNQEQATSSNLAYQNETQTDISQQQAQPCRRSSNFYNLEHREIEPHQIITQTSINQDQISENSKSRLDASNEPSLRHHKLLNETSHFSIVRSVGGGASEPVSKPRSSSIQFNTFSDGESGPDEPLTLSPNIQNPSNNSNYNLIQKPDLESSAFAGRSSNLPVSSVKDLNDDELLPTTKTALIFPRLDEGLSSDAESCEDEVEEEDEKAMDADVDADDDDDDDDVDDDITENDSLPVERGNRSLQVGQSSSLDCYSRQHQVTKPPIRLIGSVQQQQHQPNQPPVGMASDQQVELHQPKAPGTAYGGYVSQDLLDNSDLKSMTGYPNQNGQSNYWMGGSNQQQHLSTSQPSSSQHFSQRAHNNNNSFNRDEAKITSRLSSDTDNETDRLLGSQRNEQLKLAANDINSNNSSELHPVSNVMKQTANSREVLIEGVLFNVKYLGSTHSDCEGRSEKEDRIHQAEMAVHEVKFRNGESQSATEVQLFISTEKIMVLDDKHRKIMMDHSLRTISYIADIGDAIVLIVRKKNNNSDAVNDSLNRPISKISCHVFESSESHTITKSISQAFQVAYTELLKANGTGDTSSYLPKELDYQEVLNSQEMSTDELEMFARKENQREVIVPKEKGEILGLSLVESGWGSVLPTVVIANLKPDGPAYRCKKLSIGDQILSVNGISLVGLPLAECQEILRKTKTQRVARLSVVPCPITVEVKIKRPDTKYQLGFSVQNGVICSLLRGGIAERGGVRVGHRIMSINGTTVVGVPHEKIVTLLASSVGEIRMKTCLTSLYRLILGEEHPVHF